MDFSNESSDLINDNELTSKMYVDNQLNDTTIVRFNQSLQSYLKVSIGNDTSKLSKYDKINITVIIEVRSPNTGKSLLHNRTLKCINKN